MRKPDPVEVAAVAIPLLAEAVVVVLFIAAAAVWSLVLSGRLPL